jgi:hypothetical protein
MHFQLFMDSLPQLPLSDDNLQQFIHVLILILHRLFLQLEHALVIKLTRPLSLFTQNSPRTSGCSAPTICAIYFPKKFLFVLIWHRSDRAIESGLGCHGLQQVFQAIFFLARVYEQIFPSAQFTFPQTGRWRLAALGYTAAKGPQAFLQVSEHRTRAHKTALCLSGTLMLPRRNSLLVTARELQAGVV